MVKEIGLTYMELLHKAGIPQDSAEYLVETAPDKWEILKRDHFQSISRHLNCLAYSYFNIMELASLLDKFEYTLVKFSNAKTGKIEYSLSFFFDGYAVDVKDNLVTAGSLHEVFAKGVVFLIDKGFIKIQAVEVDRETWE